MVYKPTYGSHHKNCISRNRNKILIRRKLFGAKLPSSLEIDDNDGVEPDLDVYMRNLFVDTQLHLRSPEQILVAESEYAKTYKDCWNRDKKHRPDAIRVQSVFEKLLNSL